jgi:hypothetical protein
MDRLTGQADYCRERALICARQGYREIARHWIKLARSYKLAEEVSGFLDWQSRRLEPPEAFERRRA